MNLLPLSSIAIPDDRWRRDFPPDALNELQESIECRGLLHPIVVRKNGAEGGVILAAGERRLRAIQNIYALDGGFLHAGLPVPPGMVPCTEIGDLSPLEAREVEYEENARRKDLTWQEEAAATAMLMELRQSQAAAGLRPAPSVASIAEETRGYAGGTAFTAVRKNLLLADRLSDPDVAKAKSAGEAFKILQRKERHEKHAALSSEIGKTFTSAAHTLIQEDSGAWLSRCPNGVFDVILTDPPYGMGADQFAGGGKRDGEAIPSHHYADDRAAVEGAIEIAGHFYRVAKSDAHLYVFCDIEYFFQWRTALESFGWTPFRTPLIWVDPSGLRAPWPDSGPKRTWQAILFAKKGNRPCQKLLADVLTYGHDRDSDMTHMARKPIELFRDLLSRSVMPGDKVLDPFCGSGPIFPAAHALRCAATGIDKDPASCGMAAKRIGELR